MSLYRKPTIEELNLLEILIDSSIKEFPLDWKENLLVCNMNDGEMGSLKLFLEEKEFENRLFGERVSEYQFLDSDGINVIASLNIDNYGNLYELDIWKTNFGKLLTYPSL